MHTETTENDYFGTERIGKILLKVAPPVMLAMLIQALYNIVDSFFVGKYSEDALTALTVIYPLQLIIIALAVGTGVGVNTYMARKYAQGKAEEAEKAAGTGMVLEFATWIVLAIVSVLIMRPYVMMSATSERVITDAIIYGNIVSIGSLGAFLEGNWTKVHQSYGNMKLPMVAQIAGAVTNIVLDPVLIFGIGPFPQLGVAGAAYATVCGQVLAAVITGVRGFRKPPKFREILYYAKRIYFYGYSSIVMQGLYTVYIFALNVILAKFSDSAVTVLGLYYKLQSFFFIPLFGLQTCIVPILSFNYARGAYERCRKVMRSAFLISLVFMVLGIIGFIGFPEMLIRIGKPRSNRDWKTCLPDYRCKFCTGSIFTDNAGIFSGNRRRRHKSVSVITTTNCMPGADLLVILISGTGLHMVFLPGIGSDLQWNRTNPVCKDN